MGLRHQEDVLSTFSDLGVAADIIDSLAEAGIDTPFPIQSLAIPLALRGDDVIGQARTGTGKTIAFSIPLLQRSELPGDGRPRALVVAPTRELAQQVARDVALAGGRRQARVAVLYGGRAYEPQVDMLRRGVDVVVGTPGRLLDLARQRALDLSAVAVLVLDEADEMLDLGFLPDVERILAQLPARRQTLLFSATMPAPVVALARRYLTKATHLRAEAPHETAAVPTTTQHAFRTHPMDKPEVLARVLQARDRGLSMVFCRTKRTADRVTDELDRRGFAAAAVHGDLGQAAREQALRAFRSGKVDVLVATDVAARGIDVVGVTHVINYECPEDEKAYLHRIGRTGRAGGVGTAVTFVDWADIYRWRLINDAMGLPFPEPPETYSTSEHLYVELDLPPAARGVLPRGQRVRAGLTAESVEDLGETGRVRSRTVRQRTRRQSPAVPTGREHPLERGDRSGGTGRDLGPEAPPRIRRRTRRGRPISGPARPEVPPAAAPATASGGRRAASA